MEHNVEEEVVEAQIREGVEPGPGLEPHQTSASNETNVENTHTPATKEIDQQSTTNHSNGNAAAPPQLHPPDRMEVLEPPILAHGTADIAQADMAHVDMGNGMSTLLQPDMNNMNSTMTSGISADEIALYDRQIRLWGVQAQEKIRNANILLVTLKGLGNEIAKNLVLAGVASITLIDNSIVTEDDLGAQFFISEENVGQMRAAAAQPAIQRLNPRVAVHVAYIDLYAADVDPSFFAAFSLVITTDQPMPLLEPLSTACRFQKVPYYAAGSHGLYGFIFVDLIEHTYTMTKVKPNKATVIGTAETPTRTVIDVMHSKKDGKDMELVTRHETYTPLLLANSAPLPAQYYINSRRLKTVTPLLPCLRAVWDFEKQKGMPPSHSQEDLKLFTRLATQNCQQLGLPTEVLKSDFLRSFLQNLYSEISPSCAYLGGLLAQDVINVLGGREQPLQNMVLWDGEESRSDVYALVPMVQSLDATV